MDSLEWSGAITGMAGAALLATNTEISGLGFVLFLASNACWIAFGLRQRHWGLVSMQAGFTATSLLGIWRWLI